MTLLEFIHAVKSLRCTPSRTSRVVAGGEGGKEALSAYQY